MQLDWKMKINDLLKPNEGFSLNEAQVVANRCCFHIHNRAGFKHFRAFQHPFHPSTHGLDSGIYSCFFLGSPCHQALLMGTWRFPVFSLAGVNMGKEAGHPLWSHPEQRTPSAPTPTPTHPSTPKTLLLCVTPSAPDMQGNNDVRKMGLDLYSLFSWEEL